MHSLIRKECVVLIFLCFAVAQYAAAAVSAFDGQDIPSGQETGGKNEAEEGQIHHAKLLGDEESFASLLIRMQTRNTGNTTRLQCGITRGRERNGMF